jgi:prepilin-type N-terminal cleavage/methylation domain-containing protein
MMGSAMHEATFDRDSGTRGAAASPAGFTLVEMLIAMMVMTFGLLAAGQLMYVAMGSASLARSKGSAAIVAQDKLEFLADRFRQDPTLPDFTNGSHGPEQVQVTNPATGRVVNRFNVQWTVATVADPRPGVTLKAKQVCVTVTPIRSTSTTVNTQTSLNKIVNVTAIFSTRVS